MRAFCISDGEYALLGFGNMLFLGILTSMITALFPTGLDMLDMMRLVVFFIHFISHVN